MTCRPSRAALPEPLAAGGAGARRYETAETAPGWVLACAERCPACCGLPAVPPELWAVRGGTLITAHRCPTCRHGWAQHWAVEALDGAA